ncbi:MAG TPA: 3-hydroxyacyl-CoA dehydrogenase NAD-binding domain-containing protein, partial [Pyrinomonadaceae bacterium]|nr:3-hydroxyacyl-CoA dehydrogenase NAD-binding domain-containing protein [Pyrinomonadaceae bacterium]
MITVKKAAVLGAGTMGAQIAAHLANARIPVLLLDIAPRNDDTAETRPSGRVPNADDQKLDRNRIARDGFEAARKAKPAAFFTSDLASLVTVGNFADDLPKLKDCDLIIEAVV